MYAVNGPGAVITICSQSHNPDHCSLLSLLFQVINNNGSAEFVVTTNETFTVSPEFIGSRLLLKMRKMAERRLDVPIRLAVISVPAEFDERQRNYTVRAAELAGQFSRRVCIFCLSEIKFVMSHIHPLHSCFFFLLPPCRPGGSARDQRAHGCSHGVRPAQGGRVQRACG